MHLALVSSALLALHSGAPSSAEPSPPTEPAAQPAPSATDSETGRPATLYFGDVDGDGLDDVFAIGAGGEPTLLLNLGESRYEDITLPSGLATLEFATCALLADLDGDGDLDLFVGSSETRLWRNLGNASFEPVDSGIDHDLIDLAASAIDRDEDGRADLQIHTERGDLLYRNGGAGAFERVTLPGIDGAAPSRPVDAGAPVGDDAQPAPENDPPARRRLRRWIAARRAQSAPMSPAPGPNVTPGSNGGGPSAVYACSPWIQDQATGGCLNASTTPTLGLLYPMSTSLNVDTSGRVGIGTTTPTSALTVMAQNSSNISALSGSNNVHAGINVGRVAGEFAMGIASSNGNWLAGSAPGDGILRVNDPSRKILLGFGIGGQATMAVTGGNVGIGTTSPAQTLDVAGSAAIAGALGLGTANPGPGYRLDVSGNSFGHAARVMNVNNAGTSSIEFSNSTGGFQGAIGYANPGYGSPWDGNSYLIANGSDFAMVTNNSERMRITQSGNVGIGTTTPETALNVKGGSLWINGATGGNLPASAGRGLRFWHEGSLDLPVIQASDWGTLSGIDLLIQPDGGNVGMGTLFPTQKLDVVGNATISGDVGIGTNAPASKLHATMDAFNNGLILENTTDTTNIYLIPPSPTGGFTGGVGTASNHDLPLFTGNFDRVTIKADGKVGIGTSAPANTLSVASGEIQLYGSSGQPKAVMGRNLANPDRGRIFILDENFTIRAGMDFSGNSSTVFANVKNFREPNPDDASTDLVYACVEGPEAAMYVRGTATLVGGSAEVELPRHFAVMAAAEGITVQLTPLSPMSRGLCVVHKSTDSFQVRELMNGSGSYEFDWEVKAIRKGHEDYEVVRPKLTYEKQVVPEDATQPKVATFRGMGAK